MTDVHERKGPTGISCIQVLGGETVRRTDMCVCVCVCVKCLWHSQRRLHSGWPENVSAWVSWPRLVCGACVSLPGWDSLCRTSQLPGSIKGLECVPGSASLCVWDTWGERAVSYGHSKAVRWLLLL